MILFLDFDGVLHPARVYLGQEGPELAGEGSLFMWAELLCEMLADFPHVQVVLSTSWVCHLPFAQVNDFLPVPLRRRVIGSTWDHISKVPEFSRNLPLSYWRDACRYQQVRRWVVFYRVRRWIAVDDEGEGWAEADLARFIHTNSETGLSDPVARAHLFHLLSGK